MKQNGTSLLFIASSIAIVGGVTLIHDATIRGRLLSMAAALFSTGLFAYRHDSGEAKPNPSQPGGPGETKAPH